MGKVKREEILGELDENFPVASESVLVNGTHQIYQETIFRLAKPDYGKY